MHLRPLQQRSKDLRKIRLWQLLMYTRHQRIGRYCKFFYVHTYVPVIIIIIMNTDPTNTFCFDDFWFYFVFCVYWLQDTSCSDDPGFIRLEINTDWRKSQNYPSTPDRQKWFRFFRFFVPREYRRHLLHIDYRLIEGAVQMYMFDGRRRSKQ